MQRLCKWENVEVSWMCHCHSSGPSFAPGWGKAALSQITWCRWTDSFPSAMERPFFRQGHSPEPWTIRLATLTEPVLALCLARKTLSSSISQGLISSNSTIATVERNLYRIGPSSCTRDGFRLLFHDLKQFSPSVASNNSMNLPYKGRRTYMITIIRYYGKLIMLTSIFRW